MDARVRSTLVPVTRPLRRVDRSTELYPLQDAELHTPIHLTLDSLTIHAESTASTFNYLMLALLGLSSSSVLSHAASHLGISQLIATLLRALPFHASRRRMVVPAEITARNGVQQEEVFRRGGEAKGMQDAVWEFATAAHDQLRTAREMFENEEVWKGAVPPRARPVFLAGVRTCAIECLWRWWMWTD